MGIAEIVGAVLSILVTVLPVLFAHLADQKKERNALTQRSISELTAGADKLRGKSPVQ